jgi:hypothetical protein
VIEVGDLVPAHLLPPPGDAYHARMAERAEEGQLAPVDPDGSSVEIDQLLERLRWSPQERLRYLLDMLEFEERARSARPVP